MIPTKTIEELIEKHSSLERDILENYKEPCPEALVESALRNIKILEDEDFFNFKVSVKSSDVFFCNIYNFVNI